MKLISSREAVNFLSQVAPRPWVHRLLCWMALNEGLKVYSSKGIVQPYSSVMSVIVHLRERASELSGTKMDELIRQEFDEDTAARLIGRQLHDRFDDEPFVWSEDSDPLLLDVGFFLYASEIDWDTGVLKAEYLPTDGEIYDTFFSDSEFLRSMLDAPDYEVKIDGLSFEFAAIEMLLPSLSLGQSTGVITTHNERRKLIGRPPKWDWEGALAHVVSLAQHPDGLPTGPGAQARIEEIILEWFLAEAGESPSTSQVRTRATKIMQKLERAKTTK